MECFSPSQALQLCAVPSLVSAMRWLLLFSSLFNAVTALNSDGVTLLSLLRLWTYVPRSINTTWVASDSTPCLWVGVHCDKANNVVYLNLTDFGIAGQLGPEIGNCSQLQYLDFTGNNLNGQIPDTLKNLHNLKFLSFEYNQLTGEIPPSLTQIPQLQLLDLSRNSLNGSIPTSIGNMTQLLQLYLERNNLSGTIPSSFGNCDKLQHLLLGKNNLQGYIPSSIGLLTKLTILRLPWNNLSGTIPPEMGNCKYLTQLRLHSNRLEGKIPDELGKLSQLQDLKLHSNRLTGEIPLSIWKIEGLGDLLLADNNLYGELPLEMTQLKQLQNITLFNNQFSGVIPQSLGINSNLTVLDFTSNKFTGNIPPNLCFGKKLRILNLGINQLQGSIPSDFGRCQTLTRSILKQNNLTGPLPDFESNSSLTYMDISNNKIEGALPTSLGNCRHLTALILFMNKFTGLIPSELGNLVNLRTLNLSHNRLEGPLPSQLSNCAKMDRFDVGFNLLNGSLPSSFRSWTKINTLILSENQFSGGIPAFLSAFKELSELQLGGNKFGGTIPGSIGALQNLMYGLNLSSNGLIGELPAEIGNLKMLQKLDLSQNNLTGSIQVIGELISLVEANISYNSFHGSIPKILMKLLNSSMSSVLGNPGLCVRCSLSDGFACNKSSYIKPCNNKSSTQKGLSKVKIVMIALGSSIFVVLLLLGLVYIFAFGRKSKQEVSSEEEPSSLFNKVMEATENLNDRYIIGSGAHGVVYKASIDPDKAFAVKKLGFDTSKGRNQSMVREIQTLGSIKHRNLVKLEDFWFIKDYGLILYSYMPNGSLHDVLHEKTPPPTLEWSVRYKIAVGICHGLSYLHYDCDPPIVHRDIKPKNILLDSDMEPHIADFGIAKLLDQSSTSNPSISVQGTIGYIAPENAYTRANSRESDVYSYGVVLLELITRRKAVDPSFKEGTYVVDWVRSVWMDTGEINQIVDSSLAEEFLDIRIMEKVTQVLMVALRCTEKDPHRRPTMRDVTKQLSDANPQTIRTRG